MNFLIRPFQSCNASFYEAFRSNTAVTGLTNQLPDDQYTDLAIHDYSALLQDGRSKCLWTVDNARNKVLDICKKRLDNVNIARIFNFS